MGEGAPDRDINKQQTDRGVSEFGGRLEVVELTSQQQSGNRHGGRLRDERSQHGAHDQDREPPRRDGFLA